MRNRSGYTRLDTSDEVRPPGERPRARDRTAPRSARACCTPPPDPPPAARLRPPQDWHSQEHARFTAPPEEVPWGSVALALFLAAFGVAAFALAWLHWTQQLFGKEQAVRRRARWGGGAAARLPHAVHQRAAARRARVSQQRGPRCARAHRRAFHPPPPPPPPPQEVGFTIVGALTFLPGARARGGGAPAWRAAPALPGLPVHSGPTQRRGGVRAPAHPPRPAAPPPGRRVPQCHRVPLLAAHARVPLERHPPVLSRRCSARVSSDS